MERLVRPRLDSLPCGSESSLCAKIQVDQSGRAAYKKRLAVGLDEKWDRGDATRRFAVPYDFRDCALWILRNLFGPSRRHRELTCFVPSGSVLNRISPRMTLAFVGDIMPLGSSLLRAQPEISDFLSDADFLIGNFEGTILTSPAKAVLLGQKHSFRILDVLAGLFPARRTVLCCSNNHAGDFGWTHFQHSYRMLEDHGFLTVGRRDEPAIMLNGEVSISTGTAWSNQRREYVSRLADISASYDHGAKFNIAYPCWGHELQLYPGPDQIKLGVALLRQWDLLVGFHSHCPQPIASYESGGQHRLLAYSLGNFICGMRLKRYLRGLVLKVAIGPGHDGRWAAGRVEWMATCIRIARRREAILSPDHSRALGSVTP